MHIEVCFIRSQYRQVEREGSSVVFLLIISRVLPQLMCYCCRLSFILQTITSEDSTEVASLRWTII